MRVDDTEAYIFQYLEEHADKIEDFIDYRCDQFRLVQQSVQHSVFEHASIDPKNFTIYGCIARVSVITKLLERLRISRQGSENLWALYIKLEYLALKHQHPTLLDTLEMDMKLKIKSFSDSVKREVLDVYSYKLRLQVNIDAFIQTTLNKAPNDLISLLPFQKAKTKPDPIPLAETENFSTTKFLSCRATNLLCNRNQKVSSCWVTLIILFFFPQHPPFPLRPSGMLSTFTSKTTMLTPDGAKGRGRKNPRYLLLERQSRFPQFLGKGMNSLISPTHPPPPSHRKRSPTTSLLASINANYSN
ncbi:hypothetical protein CDAR_264631 [Caerostris darwini]|uniref:Uncharacterized protein n=1 Tax=Caerostris darwini TaxID=1538125 RepID=A0AAV4NNH8_9ARAC|nr:hypothetical protein CDAR_264631 [Caerostris darwini]